MQRFVTYIYAYEGGKKTKNTGYAKIETRGNAGRMEIHFAEEPRIDGEAKISFLYPEKGNWQEAPVGILLIENGRGTGQYTFLTEMKLDMKLSFEEVAGLKIAVTNGQDYMSFWKDVELSPQESMPKEEPEKPQPAEQMTEEIKEEEQRLLHTMEIPVRNVFPSYTMEDVWRNFEKNHGCVQINDEVCAIQIELSDLRELPKQYWYLGNNSFLLHGFFNYHHLLFGKLPDGKYFIGVPGGYERQERVMASVFGFPGFTPVAGLEQKNPAEIRQGVWYHILED